MEAKQTGRAAAGEQANRTAAGEPGTESRSPAELARIYAHTLKRKKRIKTHFFARIICTCQKKVVILHPETKKNALPKIWRLAGASFLERGGRPLYVVSMLKIDRPAKGANRFRVQRYYKILIYANLHTIFLRFFCIFLHFFAFLHFFLSKPLNLAIYENRQTDRKEGGRNGCTPHH